LIIISFSHFISIYVFFFSFAISFLHIPVSKNKKISIPLSEVARDVTLALGCVSVKVPCWHPCVAIKYLQFDRLLRHFACLSLSPFLLLSQLVSRFLIM
jgi:hypothetical protein